MVAFHLWSYIGSVHSLHYNYVLIMKIYLILDVIKMYRGMSSVSSIVATVLGKTINYLHFIFLKHLLKEVYLCFVLFLP